MSNWTLSGRRPYRIDLPQRLEFGPGPPRLSKRRATAPCPATSPCPCNLPSLSSGGVSATPPIAAGTRVDDPPVHTRELDAFARLGIEIKSRDGSARDRSPDVPVSTRRHHAQGRHRVRSDDVGNSSRGDRPRANWGPDGGLGGPRSGRQEPGRSSPPCSSCAARQPCR